MRVIQLGYTFLPVRGGEEVYISELSKFLARQGHEVVIVQRGFRDVFKDDRPVRYSRRITVVPVRFLAPSNFSRPVLDRQIWYNFYANAKLSEVARKGDIVIVHYPQLFFPSVWLLKKLKGVRTICVSHGVTWDNPNMSLAERLLYGWVKFLTKRALVLSDCLVANDSRFVEEAKKMYRKSLHKVRLVFNFADSRNFSPGKKAGTKGRVILCPRNLRYARGVDLAIRAMVHVNARFRDARLVILGEGELKAQLQKLVHDLGVNAEILPFADTPKMVQHYRNCDVVLIPSKYSEGTSLAGLEAMSCGVPLLVTQVGGLPDLVRDGYNGFVCKPNPEAIGKALISMLSDRKRARQMGRNGRALALSKFSYERWCEEWHRIIQEMEGRDE